MKLILAAITFGSALASAINAAAAPIAILAAENLYGDAALAIGGDRVAVRSVITTPGLDPHDYEPPPSVAVAVADAQIVIINGANYDLWIERLLAASAGNGRTVINVAALTGHTADDNPHIWYDPRVMPAAARAIADALIAVDPDGAPAYMARRDAFLATLKPIEARIKEVRERFSGTPAAATEPVFGYMAAALGLIMLNDDFQRAVMNEAEPAASDVANLVDDLRRGRVKVLFYNSQVEDAFTRSLVDIARGEGVPMVAVTETQPEGVSFAEWMLGQIDATAKALGAPAS